MAAATWTWFAAALVLPNALALVLLLVGQRSASVTQLAQLERRASICLALVVLIVGAGVAAGALRAYRATRDPAIDPALRASVLAQGISEAINCVALGVGSTPLPLAAWLALLVRRRRLARG